MISLKLIISTLLLLTALLTLSTCSDDAQEIQYAKATVIDFGNKNLLYGMHFVNKDSGILIGSYDFDRNSQVFFRTIDGGLNWELDTLQLPFQRINIISGYKKRLFINVTNFEILNSANRIFTSNDFGHVWTKYSDLGGMPKFYNDSSALNHAGSSVFKTVDDGKTWHRVLENGGATMHLTDNSTVYLLSGPSYDGIDIGTITKSTDYGETWSDEKLFMHYFEASQFLSSSLGYLINSDGQLLKTTDGFKLDTICNGIDWQATGIHFISLTEGFYAALNSVWYTRNAGKTWSKIYNSDQIIDPGMYSNGSSVFCTDQNGLLIRLTKL